MDQGLKPQFDLEHLDRIESELRIEASPYRIGLAEAMLFAGKQEIADSTAFAAQHIDHHLGLVGRHDDILFALKEDHGLRQPLRVIERRPLAVALLHRRIGPDEPVEITRFELVSVAGKRDRIAHAIVARAPCEEIAEHQRGERGVAAGAAAGDDGALRIDQTLLGEKPGAVYAVVDIDDPPVAVETLAVLAPKTGAAAVVDIEHGDAAAGPELR